MSASRLTSTLGSWNASILSTSLRMPIAERDQALQILGYDSIDSRTIILIINAIYQFVHRSVEETAHVIVAGEGIDLASSAHVGQGWTEYKALVLSSNLLAVLRLLLLILPLRDCLANWRSASEMFLNPASSLAATLRISLAYIVLKVRVRQSLRLWCRKVQYLSSWRWVFVRHRWRRVCWGYFSGFCPICVHFPKFPQQPTEELHFYGGLPKIPKRYERCWPR